MCDDSPPCVDFLLLYLWPLISLAALVFHILYFRLCMLCLFRFWNSILSHTPFFSARLCLSFYIEDWTSYLAGGYLLFIHYIARYFKS